MTTGIRWEFCCAVAHLLDLDEVPCIVLAHLTPAQRRAYVLADNKLALNAGWDLEMLSLEIGELGEAGNRWGQPRTRIADLTHIDGVLRVLVTDFETIRPKRLYRRNRYFARNELSRLCLGVLITAAGELLSADDIAGRAIAAKGFDAGDAILHTAIRQQVGSTVKRLHRSGAIENIGYNGSSSTRGSWFHSSFRGEGEA